MGNSECAQETINTEFYTTSFRPLKSGIWLPQNGRRTRRSLYIQSSQTYTISATLDSPPLFQELSFQCCVCKSLCFDAGLNKIVKCSCNNYIKRSPENKAFITIPSQPQSFDRCFEEQQSYPPIDYVPDLISLTLGIFRDRIPSSYLISGRTNFSVIFDEYISPFFKEKLRCLGVGDYFSYQNAKFKVLGSFPSYGIITERTVIYCSDVLSELPIQRIHILPISPNRFTEEVFSSSIQPYFKARVRHIMTGDYLYIDSKPYIITTCQPSDGIVDSETFFYFNGEPLEPLHSVTIVPFLEDLTFHYHQLNRENLIEEILNSYIMGYFQGFKRMISLNQIITIDGIGFKVVECWPEKGVSIDSTKIVYDGSMCRRDSNIYYNPNTILIRRGNLMEDPLYLLSQQMAQMQMMMMEVGVQNMRGASPETVSALPTHVIDALPPDPEAAKCMICLCQYEIGEEAKTLACCNVYLVHMFHSTCIGEWLRRSNFCPLCKRAVE